MQTKTTGPGCTKESAALKCCSAHQVATAKDEEDSLGNHNGLVDCAEQGKVSLRLEKQGCRACVGL